MHYVSYTCDDQLEIEATKNIAGNSEAEEEVQNIELNLSLVKDTDVCGQGEESPVTIE